VGWSFDPVQLAPIALAALLYGRRLQTLARRGDPLPAQVVAAFAAGLLVLLVAVVTPIAAIGEHRLFSVHMLQHLLIGDVAPFLLVLGLTDTQLRPWGPLRALTHPLVAIPLWAGGLWLWHLPFLYDGALRHEPVHAAEHASFLVGGLLLWSALLARVSGPAWFGPGARLAALGLVWVNGVALANVFIWSGHAWYPPYVHAPRTWGIAPLADQRTGGGVMLLEMMLVGIVAFVLIGLGWLEQAELRQRRHEERAG
jgi:putative membrane protein